MPSINSATIANFLKSRDELTIQNIRRDLWPLLLVFPLSVIIGDLRYFDLKMEISGYQSYELMLFPLGLGWLIPAFFPKKLIIPLLRIAAVLSAVLLPFEIVMPANIYRLEVFMAFQFFNGICAACAFSLFCFKLNNVERLCAMIIIEFYYGFYYTVWRAFPAVQTAGKTWGSIAVMAVYLVVVFACNSKKHEILPDTETGTLTPNRLTGGQEGSAAVFVICLDVVYYMIMCMINYIEWAENSVSSMAFGIGSFASIILIIFIQLLNNRSALYSWLLFLALSLFGLGILIFDSSVTRISGSFAYGLGDGLGYIIIYYLCGGAIKKSKFLKMFRLYCVVFFIEYFGISGAFSHAFDRFEWPNHYLAFAVVLVLCSACFLIIPLLQKKLFEADWTDGLQLKDMAEYAEPLAETEEINTKDNLNLTDREREIFTMLLSGTSPKEIAHTLKVSSHTVSFHRANLYRKLGIQSVQELFAKYTVLTGKAE
ncbi:MAG: LuxR C-terminal-related transcriptional regulator [Treponema sp.]|jgi:DNA-binding CsgD family transcriptional regulator|nr:LuxR C-terminal-related transcriptional regulator [Treponema sp.]